MSLINDALKRAKQAAPPPAPDLQFRPADPAAESREGPGLSIVAVLLALAVFGGIGYWYFAGVRPETRARSAPAESTPASANEPGGTSPAPAAEPAAPGVASPAPGAGAAAVAPASDSLPKPASPPGVALSPAATPVSPPDSQLAAGTNPAVAAPPAPAPLKLQGIVYNPSRPSAVISGKTVFRGDRVGTFRVLQIGVDSVTLAGAGQTNTLMLAD